ncbi:leucine-rich repeat domain-containing protein [Bernardetia sp. MNP-M8]|uniref:leucine-rich repeat domain-containing protein n=1 Tax=Bernardetia sp. MNP-M8 TaxID=3127470 RepID=UPI0030D2D918
MSKIAERLIAENLETKNLYLDLGNCGLDGTEDIYAPLSEATHLRTLVFSNEWEEWDKEEKVYVTKKSNNKERGNRILYIPTSLPSCIEKLIIRGNWNKKYSFKNISVLSELKNLTTLSLDSSQISDIFVLSELKNLTSLSINSDQISDISVLLELKNLTNLSINSDQISDISVLSELKKLTSLNLNSDEISDISVLSELKKLTSLNLNSSQISNISVLSELKKLTDLSLHSNQISDISVLSELKNLIDLSLHSNQISDISVLSELNNLTDLSFSSHQITDISFLSKLNNLTNLSINSSQISDISVLLELKNLTSLKLNSHQISDISVLSELKNLTDLSLDSHQINDISVLSELKNLTDLSLDSHQINDISVLSELKNLTDLRLDSHQISDISVLSELKNLTDLRLDSHQISDISVLSELKNLTDLRLDSHQINDISVLSELKNLTDLSLYSHQINDISVLSELKNLTDLSLYSHQINDISVLSKLKNLTDLSLYSHQISDISVLSKLKNLTDLSLYSHQISDISVLSELKNLTDLSINSDEISDISVLSELKNLTSLSINSEKISDISVLSELKNLTSLSIYSDGLSDISVLSELKNLTSLSIYSDGLSDISVLSELKNLNFLSLFSYQINDISILSQLRKLTYLSIIYANQISDISVLSELKNLTDLSLDNSQISDISVLSELKKLTDLSLDDSQISDISVLSELKNLTSLSFDNSQISDISVLSELKNLTSLSIYSNEISDVSVLSELKNLTYLRMYSDEISDISVLSELKNLTSLSIDSNEISDISVLSELKNLTTLRLNSNEISNISVLSELKNLTTLRLNSNEISNISVLSKLKNLTDLSLNDSQISDISVLSDLKNLTDLSFNDSQISDISVLPELKNLTRVMCANGNLKDGEQIENLLKKINLYELKLYGNPINYLPKNLLGESEFSNCLEDLRNYYNNQDFVPNNEIKVVLLGNGMVGKSTLLKRLLKPNEDWEEVKIKLSKRTEGIEIEEILFQLNDDTNLRLNIWDFGGQEVYHGTHRLFLDKDAVYIIVWALETDERKYEIRQPLQYWLDYVQDLSIDSPIILVNSQSDKNNENHEEQIREQQQISWNEKYKHNVVNHYLPISAYKNTGFEELKGAIKKAIDGKLKDNVQAKIPKNWASIRQILRERRHENEITHKDYLLVCKEYEVSNSEANTILTFLYRTGFLYYQKQLSQNIILNQKWAIEGIYEVLKPKSIAYFAKGKVSLLSLTDFWTDKGYSQKEIDTFIGFMISSEICFCQEQENYKELSNPTFIVPHYLSTPEYTYTDWSDSSSLHLIYKPQFFHKGIAERFLSRLGRLSTKQVVWKDGMRMESSQFLGKALVKFDRDKKEVYIRTTSHKLLDAIIKELDNILDEKVHTTPSGDVTLFYSIDGNDFVNKDDILKLSRLGASLVDSREGNEIEISLLKNKYNFDVKIILMSNTGMGKSTIVEHLLKSDEKSKSIEKKIDLKLEEIDKKQEESTLKKEAENKINPSPPQDDSEIGKQKQLIDNQNNIISNIEICILHEQEVMKNRDSSAIDMKRAEEEIELYEELLDKAKTKLQTLEEKLPFLQNTNSTEMEMQNTPLKIFISYCSRDRDLRETFVDYLKIQLPSCTNKYEVWTDEGINVGEDWDKQIQNALKESKIAILLISTAFLGSKYCIVDEFEKMLIKRREEGYIIVPVLIRECRAFKNEELKKMQFFKTYKSEYDVTNVNERNDFMPLEELVDIANPSERLLNKYFMKLTDKLDEVVNKVYE